MNPPTPSPTPEEPPIHEIINRATPDQPEVTPLTVCTCVKLHDDRPCNCVCHDRCEYEGNWPYEPCKKCGHSGTSANHVTIRPIDALTDRLHAVERENAELLQVVEMARALERASHISESAIANALAGLRVRLEALER